ncbi:hypothetical protein [Paenibacillus alvei]|uniref:Uncharacterized protein n=1 Tax=Paenibacillus alvei TaxID=44250 RepID=A0A383RFP8_PAEAL|nr:hypothetical protein [Paenibacillus alvei]SYX85412.1 protein of unknown function [Paenibacillus alvei]
MQFFVCGAWYATAGLALSKYGLSFIIGTAYSVGSIASIIAPTPTVSVIFYIFAIASLLLGIFSFTLPNTSAPAKGKPLSVRDLLCLEAQ